MLNLLQYDILDQFGETAAYLNTREFTFDEAVEILVEKNWGERHTWMYEYDVRAESRLSLYQDISC